MLDNYRKWGARMKKKVWWTAVVLAVLVSIYAVIQYYVLGPDRAGFVSMKLEEQALGRIWYAMLYVHVAGSAAALAIGPFNLLQSIRNRHMKLHRIMGRVYMAGIAAGGLSGLYLAFEATGGAVSTAGFLSLNLLWLASAYMAVRTIRTKQVDLHRRWMIRNYALTLAGVTLRLWLGMFVAAFGEENFTHSYMIIAWLCWVPNAIAAEWYIRRVGTR